MIANWRRWIGLGLVVLAAVFALYGVFSSAPAAASRDVYSSLQCGHWCVHRCCELFGVPMDLGSIQNRLPYDPAGHSMAQLSEVLGSKGLAAHGERKSLSELRRGRFPCIAHLTDPDHFVVVVAVDDERIHVYDGAGQRTTRALEEVAKRWSGYILSVSRSASPAVDTNGPPAPTRNPRIRFDALLVDKGMVGARGERIRFDFPFQNIGSSDLSILSVDSSCRCLSVEKPDTVIPPGGKGRLSFVYQPPARGGTFQHDVLVETNASGSRLVRLKAAGFADTGIQVVPSRFDLGNVAMGTRHVNYCFVHDAREWREASITKITSNLRDFTATQYSNNDPQFLRAYASSGVPDVVVDRNVRVIQFAWTPELKSPSRVEGQLEIHTTAKGFERIFVPVVAKVVPPVRAYPSVILFDPSPHGESATQSILLTSVIDAPFRITSVTTDKGTIERKFASTFGKEAKLDLVLPRSAAAAPPSLVRVSVALADKAEEISLELPVFVKSR